MHGMPPSAGLSDSDWIEHYRTLEKPLYNVVYRWLWDAHESQDVVQEAFLRCWRSRSRIRPEGFRAFVYRTALNLAANRRRRRKLWRFVSFDAEADEPARPGATGSTGDHSHLFTREVRAALDALARPLKEVLLLREIAGMSYIEIAAVLGIRQGTVGSRHHRALAALRGRLGIEGAGK